MKYQILHYHPNAEDLINDLSRDLGGSKKEFRKKVRHEANIFFDEWLWILDSMRDVCDSIEIFEKLCKIFSDKFGGTLLIFEADEFSGEHDSSKVYFAIYGE